MLGIWMRLIIIISAVLHYFWRAMEEDEIDSLVQNEKRASSFNSVAYTGPDGLFYCLLN